MDKYQLNQEGYLYGVVNGPYKVIIKRIENKRYFLSYITQPKDYHGNGSMLSNIEMKRHFISLDEYDTAIHKYNGK